MFIVCHKKLFNVLGYGESISYWSNGYPVITEKNIAFIAEDVVIHETDKSLPEDLDYNTGKYCYTEEKGFYINPDYKEPDPSNTYGIPDELYSQIIDDYTLELMEGGVM